MRKWVWARGEEGTSVVEFALVAPVLLLVLVGILDLGRAVNAYVTVSNAAREGSHYAIIHPTAAPSAIVNAVRTRVIPLDETKVVVTSSYYNGSTFVPWPAGGVPASAPSPSAIPVQVSVCFPWSAVTFIGRFFTAASPAPCGAGDAYFQATSTSDVTR
ncbi:MAG: pilus assembly protein [Chloroflexota bacterium]|nr:pilus assembly protein [Chloroflexota bacterium]